jgi:5-methylcytosine-specific restriction endonuclease McrA
MEIETINADKFNAYTPKVYEQYEFREWLITITNQNGRDELIGFATPTKYSHLLNESNFMWFDDIADENGINPKIDENGELDYGDFDYLIADPDDTCVYFQNKVNTKSSACILDYMVNEIIDYTLPKNTIRTSHKKKTVQYKIVTLKQIQKKSISPKSSKSKRGFNHIAWSSLVKLRDGKCVKCGSLYDLHSHHIKPYKTHPELRYDVNNGVTLCGSCHREYHKKNGR